MQEDLRVRKHVNILPSLGMYFHFNDENDFMEAVDPFGCAEHLVESILKNFSLWVSGTLLSDICGRVRLFVRCLAW